MLVSGLREGERRAPSSTRKIFWMLSIVAVIGWAYILLQSELFELQQVVVEGAKMNDPLDIEREVYHLLDQDRGWRPWHSRHLLFIQSSELAHALEQAFYLEHVDLQKEGRHILRLKIKEYPHRLVIYKDQDFYWVDLRGELDGALTKDERQQVLGRVYGKRVADTNEPPLVRINDLQVGTSTAMVFSSDRLKSFISFTVALQKLQLPYREFRLDTATSTKVSLMNERGTPVYFDVQAPGSLERQLQTYKAFWDHQGTIKGPPLYQYIDVRVPDMIYLR